MYTIKGEIISTLEITKSTFITYLKNINNVEDAKKYVQQIKDEHPDATHHVVAMTIGKTGEYGQANDDGEPSGTAGLPVLDVFRKNDITNFVCVVVRYFGGIKLGAGGLVRAYSKSASTALKQLEIVPIIEYKHISITFDYSFLNIIENRLSEYNILQKTFTSSVSFIIKLPIDKVDTVISQLIALTNSLIEIRLLDFTEE